MTLRTDPDKLRAWQQRSRKPMNRGKLPSLTYEEARQAADRRHAEDRVTVATGKFHSARRRINKIGPRTLEWQAAWRFLKPRLQAAGRTRCEFDWQEVAHDCFGPLDPVHSKKRREMVGSDIYAVALGCREIHTWLDEQCTHDFMEATVVEAINRHGGLILP